MAKDTKHKIFNPLRDRTVQREHVTVSADADGKMTATAAIYNERAGECAKCKNAMVMSQIANGDQVHFCPKCRVTNPLPH